METVWAEYGEALNLDFVLWEPDGTDLLGTAVHAAGDTKLMGDGAAEANTTNGFTDEGIGYSIELTAAEMSKARLIFYCRDQGTKAWLDKAIRLLTFGHPSASDPRGVIGKGTLQAGGTTSCTLASGEVGSDGFLNGAILEFYSGTGARQHRVIEGSTAVDDVVTWEDALAVAVDGTTKYRILGAPTTAGIQAEIASALATYDPPTKAELDTAAGNILTRLGTPAGADISEDISGIIASTQGLPNGIKENTARPDFAFFMVQSSDHVSAATGLTVTAERSIDGGVFGACANSPVEIGSGWYAIDLAASDLNGEIIILKFTAAGADARGITIVTEP